MFKKQQKWIALLVMLTFVWLLQVSTMPLAAANTTEKVSSANNDQGPRFIEEEGNSSSQVTKKHSILPIILIGLGVITATALVYFLVIKKPKYTLTVTLGTGCSGTPAVTGTYKKGTVVSYSFTPQPGYINLQVKLDGVDVAASGTVTMDKNKALTVTSQLLDIRGSWTFSFIATNTVKNWSWTLTFAGDGKNGTFTDNYADAGTYVVTGSNVTWKYNAWNISGTGTFTGLNAMSGTATFSGVLIGSVLVTAANWTATRTGASTSIAAPKTSAKTILVKEEKK
jgi:hypothetical protein